MPDEAPPCEQCRHARQYRPDFLSPAAPAALVCTHPSALRINDGAVWAVTLAREDCKGVRHKRQR